MRHLLIRIAFVTLLPLAVVTGCSAAPGSEPGQPTANSSANNDRSNDSDGANIPFPRIGSCDELARVAAAYVEGIPLDEEISHVEHEDVSCYWNHDPEDIDSFEQIQIFSIDIAVGDEDLSLMEEGFKSIGSDMLFHDPRLDDMGGFGIWLDADTSVVGAASGTVHLPGLEIRFGDGRVGAQNYLERDTMVDLALAILAHG